MGVHQALSVLEESYSVASNTSRVRVRWVSQQWGESYNAYKRTAYWYLSINGGAEREYSVTYTLDANATVTILDEILVIDHNSDGTGTVRVRTWMDTGISVGVVTNQQELKLTTIQRASNITSASNRTLGSACSVTWTPLATNFTYKLNFSLGGWSHTTGVIKPNTTEPYTYTNYTLPLEVASWLPNSSTGTMKVTLATYSDKNGTVQVDSDSSKTFTITVPNNASTQPTVSMSLAPLSGLSSPYNELYIQGLSKVKATLDCGAKYGASVVASNITVNGITYESPYESNILPQLGRVTVKATVKDSRGFYGTYYEEIHVEPYEKPYLMAFSGEDSIIAARCDSSANFTDSGTYLKIKAKAVVYAFDIDGVRYNYGNIKYRYRQEGGRYTDWMTILNGQEDNSDEVITPPLEDGALETQSNYQVQIVAFDDFCESAPITMVIPCDVAYMHRPAGGNGMGLGGYSSGDGNLDIYWKTIARGGLSLLASTGDEIPLDSTMPLPRGQVEEGWEPNALENGAYVVTDSKPLVYGGTVIMYNGILIQVNGTVDGSVKFQIALTSDETRNPFYRAYWYGNWGNWRSFNL